VPHREYSMIAALLCAMPAFAQNPPTKPESAPATASSAMETALIRDSYEVVQLKRDRKTFRLFLSCKANGRSLQLLVDTGANKNSLSTDVAKEMQLGPTQDSTVVAGNTVHKVQLARCKDFKVGGLPASEVELLLTDDSASRELLTKEGAMVFDGQIGAEWLTRYSCVIDFATSRLYCLDPAKKAARPAARGKDSSIRRELTRNGYDAVNLIVYKATSELLTDCTANGTPIHLMLDTGATYTSIDEEIAKRLKVTTKESSLIMKTTGTNTIKIRTALLDSLVIGNLSLVNPDIFVMDFSVRRQQAKANGGVALEGLLGAMSLYLWSAVIDFRDSALYFIEPLKRELASFSGQWQASRVQYFGVVESADNAKKWRLSIENETVELQSGKETWRGAYGVNLRWSNSQFQFRVASSNAVAKKATYLGIYDFDESRNRFALCLCLDPTQTDYPNDMTSTKDNKRVLIEFERVASAPR